MTITVDNELITNRYELADWVYKKVKERLMNDTPQAPETVASSSLDLSQDVGGFLPTKAANALKSKNIVTLQDILNKNQRKLMQIDNFGRQSLDSLILLFFKHNLYIKQ